MYTLRKNVFVSYSWNLFKYVVLDHRNTNMKTFWKYKSNVANFEFVMYMSYTFFHFQLHIFWGNFCLAFKLKSVLFFIILIFYHFCVCFNYLQAFRVIKSWSHDLKCFFYLNINDTTCFYSVLNGLRLETSYPLTKCIQPVT